MKQLNPLQVTNDKIIERSNAEHLLELFFCDTTTKWHVVFNAVTFGTYKTKLGAVKLANKFIFKYSLK